jgi:hypothetical protein
MKTWEAHEDKEIWFREGILSGESLFSIDIKREEKDQKYQKHEDKGRNPKESYPFPLMSKGERNTRRERSGALVTSGV